MFAARMFLSKWGVPLALLLAAVSLPDSSAQWQFTMLLLASLFHMAWWGHLLLHQVGGGSDWVEKTFFLKVCVGQFVLLLAWAAASPLLYLLQRALEFHLLFPLAGIALVVATVHLARDGRRSFVTSLGVKELGHAALLVAAGVCLFKLAAYYSARSGALGLDTHQHIFYTADLYEAAYLKLAAGSTEWIDRYPKGLHAIAALWALPGFGDHQGNFLKVMPGLQLLLAVLSITEICVLALESVDNKVLRSAWWMVLALGLGYMFYRGTRFVYPVPDLNSTARLSSAAVLFVPALVGALAALFPSRRTVSLAAATLPIAAAVAAKFNPALFVAFATVSVPMWVLMMSCALWRQVALWRCGAALLVVGMVAGAALLVSDPLYLSLLASKSTLMSAAIDAIAGVRPLPASAMGGVLPSAWTVSDLLEVLWRNLMNGSSIAVATLPDSSMVISHKLMVGMRYLIWVALGIWLLHRALGRGQGGRAGTVVAALQVSLLAGTWLNDVLARSVADIVGSATIEASILSTYTRGFSNILVLFVLPIHFVLSTTLLMDVVGRIIPIPRWRWAVLGSAGGVVALALCGRLWPIPHAPPPGSLGWWQPIKEAQVDAFQELESKIPKDALVIAEATAATLNGREEWILPVGDSTAYLPFSRRRYLFNVRLGDGYALNFSDLNNAFCNGTEASARRFLRDHGVRFLFAVDPNGVTQQQVMERTYCGVKLSSLGLIYPPYARGEGGLAVYELRP